MRADRRRFLAAAALLPAAPLVLARADTPRRFVFVIQRGAADGLDTLIPYADPGYARARGALAIDPAQALRLDGSFALHPSLTTLAALHAAGEARAFHAVASPYRDRSHFDGQNVLETGGRMPFERKDGWLNRLLGLLPGGGPLAVALAPAVPLALRGPAEVLSHAPSTLPPATSELAQRVAQLYAGDAQLQALWQAAQAGQGMAGDAAAGGRRADPAVLGQRAAGLLVRPDGPRVAMIETLGWDTHSAQASRLGAQLKGLDALLGALKDGLGAAWSQTVVLVATEFGRTVAANGTGGTDHGTAAAAFLVGGAVQGGPVVADWPGLGTADLHEGRDLRPTLALDALVSAVCAQTFGLDPERCTAQLFPGARPDRRLTGLVRA